MVVDARLRNQAKGGGTRARKPERERRKVREQRFPKQLVAPARTRHQLEHLVRCCHERTGKSDTLRLIGVEEGGIGAALQRQRPASTPD